MKHKHYLRALALLASVVGVGAWDVANPDDPAAHAAAREAVQALGPNRGALDFVPDIRTIEGLEARSLSARATDVDAILVEIGADVREQQIVIEFSGDVLFDFDKADIKPEAKPRLEKLAAVIRERATGIVSIEGHTDSVGDDEYNLRLSEKRAEAVKVWLSGKDGLSSRMYRTKGSGKSRPKAPNAHPDGSDNPEGRALNRRVTVTIDTSSSAAR